MEVFLESIHRIWLNFETWVVIGGLISVGVTIFLMGLFKSVLANRIKNKAVRKTVLAFASLFVVAGVTAVYLYTNTAHGLDYFWYMYAVNAVGTIVVYFFYENTHVRELLSLIGRNTVFKLGRAIFCEKSLGSDLASELREDARTIAKSYKDDDLKNL